MIDLSIIGFVATILIPPLVTALLLAADKCFFKDKLAYWPRQIIIGVIFGFVAIIQTEWAVPFHDALINVRDAAPVCAGLIFGGPAGIIAGVIGGVERWLAVYWGAGQFTRLACSLGTIIAGVYAALFHKFIFEKKMPSLLYAFAIGLVAEVIHLTLVMLTKPNQIEEAFAIVSASVGPLMIGVSLSVCLSVLVARIISKNALVTIDKIHGIARSVQAWILCVTVVCLVLIVAALAIFQARVLDAQVESTLSSNLQVARQDIVDSLHKDLLSVAADAAAASGGVSQTTSARCTAVADEIGLDELSAIDQNGIVIASNRADHVGFDMSSTPETAAFLVLLNGTEELTQTQRASADDPSRLIKYVGVAADGGFYEVGFDYARLVAESKKQVKNSTRNTVIGKTGGIVIASPNNEILSIPAPLEQMQSQITSLLSGFNDNDARKVTVTTVDGTRMYCMFDTYEGFRAIALYPVSEASFSLAMTLLVTVFLEIIMFSILLFFIYIAVNKVVIKNIYRVNKGLGRIAEGELDTVIDVRAYKEFDELSDDVNSTVDVLKNYIAQESERMRKELEYAHTIQLNSIPSTFPAFPERHDFDLHANIELAKEVGGDFYDYYLVDDDHLMLLIADVSGKGIPAALFMMTAKTMLEGLAKSKITPAEVLEQTNDLLAQDNESSMFVTVWLAMVDLRTGHTVFANAGHNKPALCRAGGTYELIDQQVDMSVGFMAGQTYCNQEIDLLPGDALFLFTDGATEANNKQGERFEEPRLLEVLDSCAGKTSEAVCRTVTAEVERFAGGVEQFDDITMLAFKYLGPDAREADASASDVFTDTLTLDAHDANIHVIIDFVNAQLKSHDFPANAYSQVGIIIDELAANIAHYAYSDDEGTFTVRIEIEHGEGDSRTLTLSFIDQGVPFNPLEHEGADLSIPATEREPGGLGIIIVKDMVDDIRYEYSDGSNILTLTKHF